MKKDKFLEERFDSYVRGTPSYGATDRAKEQMERKKSAPKVFWRALVPSVCVLVVLVVVGIIAFGNFGSLKSTNQSDFSKPSEDDNSGETIGGEFYSDILLAGSLNAYSEAPKGMEFVKKFATSKNTAVNEFVYYKKDNSVALFKADVSASVRGRRQDAVIYAEYVDETYLLLKDFADGEEKYYKNCSYTVSSTTDNGEPVSNIYLKHKGIKYYISVRSSDKNVAMDYIKLIVG